MRILTRSQNSKIHLQSFQPKKLPQDKKPLDQSEVRAERIESRTLKPDHWTVRVSDRKAGKPAGNRKLIKSTEKWTNQSFVNRAQFFI